METYDQMYYRTVRKFRPRLSRRTDTMVRCVFCEILLVSKFGGKLRRKYCDGCAQSPKIKKVLNYLYQRRKYEKNLGMKVTPLDQKMFHSLINNI